MIFKVFSSLSDSLINLFSPKEDYGVFRVELSPWVHVCMVPAWQPGLLLRCGCPPSLQPLHQLLGDVGQSILKWWSCNQKHVLVTSGCEREAVIHRSPLPRWEIYPLEFLETSEKKKPLVNRPVLSCPVLQAGSKPGGQWFCELPGEPIKCADGVKAQGLC